MSDQIIVEGLEVMAFVGVPDEERAQAQRLEISIVLHLDLTKAASSERLNYTVDYAEVQIRVIEVVLHRPRPLIETVAEDIAQMILLRFHVQRVEVEVRKFILQNVKSVAVRVVREALHKN